MCRQRSQSISDSEMSNPRNHSSGGSESEIVEDGHPSNQAGEEMVEDVSRGHGEERDEPENMVQNPREDVGMDSPVEGLESDSEADTSDYLDNPISEDFDTENDQWNCEWADYDEDEELDAIASDEEKFKFLEEMLEEPNELRLGELDECRQLDSSQYEYHSLTPGIPVDLLSEADIDDIRAFKLQMAANIPRVAFNQMRYAFRHKLEISSLYVIAHKLAVLSKLEPQWYDCCVKSCVAYTDDELKDAEECPECSEPRWILNTRRARRMFCYIPLIPRLQMLFSNSKTVNALLYRYRYKHILGEVSDVFDSEHYRNLCKTKVTVDGEEMPYKYFSGKYDIAFSVCLDSYLLYKRRRGGPSATPIVLQIYNWPPQIRTHLSHLRCLGVIPGPKAPKRMRTFLVPFDDECAQLARGVNTFDCVESQNFLLRGYTLFPLGDIIAIEKFLNIKGHNGKCPCRSCMIQAIISGDKTYYPPLMHPDNRSWDPRALPMRTHSSWKEVTEKIEAVTTKKAKNEIAKYYGIKGMPALGRVDSLDYARGVPWDFMHLLFENVIKNLVNLWMGKFKGLDAGKEDWVIPEHLWKDIGQETVSSVRNIPAAFVRSLGNLWEDQTHYTAEGWAFWFMYLAPILLHGRFTKQKYYDHMCKLVMILKTCMQFTLKSVEIDKLEGDIISWVQEYEKYVTEIN